MIASIEAVRKLTGKTKVYIRPFPATGSKKMETQDHDKQTSECEGEYRTGKPKRVLLEVFQLVEV